MSEWASELAAEDSLLYLADEFHWKDLPTGTQTEAYADMRGSSRLAMPREVTVADLHKLLRKLAAAFSSIRQVNIGSGYEDWLSE